MNVDFGLVLPAGLSKCQINKSSNDLPTAPALLWGFCSADEPVWQASIDLASSPASAKGYYPGPLGGLGSVIAAGTWPLGAAQENLYARLTGAELRARPIPERLVTMACGDGSLPEADDLNGSTVRSRYWFGWPGAAALLAASTRARWQP